MDSDRLLGCMKRGATFHLSINLGLFGWIAWHHWSHTASAVAWVLGGALLLRWAFARWDH